MTKSHSLSMKRPANCPEGEELLSQFTDAASKYHSLLLTLRKAMNLGDGALLQQAVRKSDKARTVSSAALRSMMGHLRDHHPLFASRSKLGHMHSPVRFP